MMSADAEVSMLSLLLEGLSRFECLGLSKETAGMCLTCLQLNPQT